MYIFGTSSWCLWIAKVRDQHTTVRRASLVTVNVSAGTPTECLWRSPVYRTGGGGGVGVWEDVVGVRRPALLIFTLFQSNIYKFNVREYPREFMSWKRTTFNSMIAWHEVSYPC